MTAAIAGSEAVHRYEVFAHSAGSGAPWSNPVKFLGSKEASPRRRTYRGEGCCQEWKAKARKSRMASAEGAPPPKSWAMSSREAA